MDYTSVNAYLQKLYSAKAYKALPEAERQQVVFEAQELLESHFDKKKLTDRTVGLQVMFNLEGDDEEYAKLKRHGVKSYSVKGVSVTFESLTAAGVSPGVADLLLPKSGAAVGRFY